MTDEATPPPPHLIVLSGEHKGDVIVLDDDLPVVFGRRTGIQLPEKALDDVHCQVFASGGRWFIQDFGSGSGTWLGDERVEGLRPLEFGRSFRIGETHVAILLPDHTVQAKFTSEAEDALRAAGGSGGDPDEAKTHPMPGAPAAAATTEPAADAQGAAAPSASSVEAIDAAEKTARRLGGATDIFDLETPPPADDEAPVGDATATELQVHDSLGDYDIIELLGAGSLGKVYKGYDRRRRRVVAIKVLDPMLAQSQKTVARFLRGAKAGGRLSHRHIVRVLAAGHAHGRIYVTMEFVEGLNLEQFCMASGGKLVPRVALGIMNRITDALIYAHGKGVVHRNVTPRNILVGSGGFPKLADLSLAKRGTSKPREGMQITSQGQVLARSVYTAPEGLLGDVMDERTDVWGVGAALFFALSDTPPYGRDPKLLTQRIMGQEIEDLGRLAKGTSERLRALLERCLHPDPSQRYQKMRDLRDAIAELPELTV